MSATVILPAVSLCRPADPVVFTIEADEIDLLRERNQRRVNDIKRRLGAKLIGHPAYQFNPRHSNTPDIYQTARAPFLAAIALAAKFDREANPAFRRASAIRNLHTGS